jgi:phage recombination protein Bet
MSNELATYQPHGLALDGQQDWWTDKQLAALRQIGVDRASNGDLAVFMHVCQRTGLDPFARQIYMIQRDGKQVIQTGIDGMRLVARRAVDRNGETLSIGSPEWCGPDGVWRDVWLHDEPPAAARVTVTRGGGTFTGLALWREYVQTKRDGTITMMWRTRSAGQLAKCAEALALRKACPQDLSGIYSDDEMQHTDTPTAPPTVPVPDRLAQLTAEPPIVTVEESADVVPDPAYAEVVESPLLNTSSALAKRLYATINQGGVPEAQRIPFLASAVGRPLTSSKELTQDEAREVLDNFDALLASFMGADS